MRSTLPAACSTRSTQHWTLSADYTHEQGNHGYRAYNFTAGVNLFAPLSGSEPATFVPELLRLFKSDNRSSYNALMMHLQGKYAPASLIANYTFSKAQTWGCVLGELFDYVNGVCDPLNPFGPGDYGPSGEDVTHRFVLRGNLHLPGGFEVTTLTQAESARPFTITTADNSGRISVNGVPTSLDRVSWQGLHPSGRASHPTVQDSRSLVDHAVCRILQFVQPEQSRSELRNERRRVAGAGVASAIGKHHRHLHERGVLDDRAGHAPQSAGSSVGRFGDFFGPGTTVGIPFAAQLGVRVSF